MNSQQDPSPENGSNDLEAVLKLARESYAEVLDATKHHDDKVGRYLAALAFLTSGGIALLFNQSLVGTRFSFGGSLPWAGTANSYPVLAWTAGVFFILLFASIVMLLLSLRNPLKGMKRNRDSDASLSGSLIYFTFIARRSEEQWKGEWDAGVDQMTEAMKRSYVRESHNLAERTVYKYKFLNKASDAFVAAIFVLGFAVLLATKATTASEVVILGRGSGFAIGALSVLFTIMILTPQFVDRVSASKSVDRIAVLYIVVPSFIAIHAWQFAADNRSLIALLLVFGAVVFGAYPYSAATDGETAKLWSKSNVPLVFEAIVALALSSAALLCGGPFILVAAISPPIVLALWSTIGDALEPAKFIGLRALELVGHDLVGRLLHFLRRQVDKWRR